MLRHVRPTSTEVTEGEPAQSALLLAKAAGLLYRKPTSPSRQSVGNVFFKMINEATVITVIIYGSITFQDTGKKT